ncbi:CheF family chemotaxis protein [Halonotius sp. GCM10025705]|uniref:CheF family chemotaxis protein n=1 Tax=Halonotius sp. GCM10025705 TaxID=3252678 RepID=UPI00361962C0
MSEEVVADFTGKLLTEDIEQLKPVKGRVLLNREQLVLVTGEGKETIFLSKIVSTNPGSVADSVSQFLEEAIAIAYERNGTRRQAIIGGSPETIAKFRTLLFKLLIGKQTVIAKHPAKRGGRVTDAPARKMLLDLSESAIELTLDDKTARINVEAVIGFEHEQRELMDRARPTLILDHAAGSTTLTTYISLLSKRKLTFLSQFVRLNYSKVVDDVRQTEVSDTETQALISLYSAGGNASLDGIVTDDDTDAQTVAEHLLEKELVTEEEGVLYLTSRGEIVVTEQLESVNE